MSSNFINSEEQKKEENANPEKLRPKTVVEQDDEIEFSDEYVYAWIQCTTDE
jgi:hypothetical protein